MLWTEDNLNFEVNDYYKKALQEKKYAFAADSLRFKILKKYGGFYLDVDVELLSSLDIFLNHKFFMGFESDKFIAPGLIIGCEPENEIIAKIDNYYNTHEFINNGDKTITVCDIVTEILKENGVLINNTTQEFKDGMFVYASDYFCPKSLTTGQIEKTENTISIHHYLASWIKKSTRVKTKLLQVTKRIMGKKLVEKLKSKRKSKDE